MEFALPEADAMLRRGALALHALSDQDQRWLLARLPVARRSELEALVAELQVLGVPADHRVAQAAIGHDRRAHRSAPAAKPPLKGVEAAMPIFKSASAAQLGELLQHEPAALIAHALALHGSSEDENAPALSRVLVEQLALLLAPGAGKLLPVHATVERRVPVWRTWARRLS